MFSFVQAPDWVDAEECHRCRVQFGVMTRKVGGTFLKVGQRFYGFPSFIYNTVTWIISPHVEIDLNLFSLGFSSTTVVLVARFSVENVHLNIQQFQNLA